MYYFYHENMHWIAKLSSVIISLYHSKVVGENFIITVGTLDVLLYNK